MWDTNKTTAFLWAFVCWAILLASSCKERASDVSAAGGAQILSSQIDDFTSLPYVTPGEVFTDVKLRFGEAGAQKLLQLFLDNVRASSGNPSTIQQLTAVHAAHIPGTPDPRKMIDTLTQKPEALNTLPSFPLSAMPHLHQALIGKSTFNDVLPANVKPYVYANQSQFSLVSGQSTDPACAPTGQVHEPMLQEIDIYATVTVPSKQTVPCYKKNSVELAKLLNTLANALVGGAQANLSLDGASAQSVTNPTELLQALFAQGYTVELFTTRAFVDFFGMTYKRVDGTYAAIRSPLWYQVKYLGRDVTIPTEHSNYGVAVFKGQERVAQTHYYIGLPRGVDPDQVSFWRPHVDQDHRWTAKVVTYGEHFDDSTGVPRIAAWIENANRVMHGFQWLKQSFNLPFNSYISFICNDSTALALTASQVQANVVNARVNMTFPIIRAQSVTLAGNKVVQVGNSLAKVSGIDPARADALYPPDQLLESTGDAFARRIRSSFSDQARLAAFPDFRDVLAQLPPAP